MEAEGTPLGELAAKEQILKRSGYRYSFDRELYVNRALRKAFSVEFIEDHSADEVRTLAGGSSPNPRWQFFFNAPPSPAVEQELANLLG